MIRTPDIKTLLLRWRADPLVALLALANAAVFAYALLYIQVLYFRALTLQRAADSLLHVAILVVVPYLLWRSRLRLSRAWFLGAVVVLFFATRLAWLSLVPTTPISDFETYHKLAEIIAHGEKTGYIGGLTNGWGYPIVLAPFYRLFGNGLWVPKSFNLLAGALSLVLMYATGCRLGGERLGRLAAVLFLLWPVQWTYTSVIGSEHLALLVGLAAIYFLHRAWQSDRFPWGDLLALAALLVLGFTTRPTMLVYPLAAAGALLLKDGLRRSAVARAACTLALFVAIYAGYQVGLRWVNDGQVPKTARAVALNLLAGTDFSTRGTYLDEVHGDFMRALPEQQAVREALAISLQRVREQPIHTVLHLAADKLGILWGGSYYGVLYSTASMAQGAAAEPWLSSHPAELHQLDLFASFFQKFILTAALWGCLRASTGTLRMHRGLLLMVLLVALGASAVHTVFVTDGRYQYSFEPALLFLAAISLLPYRFSEQETA